MKGRKTEEMKSVERTEREKGEGKVKERRGVIGSEEKKIKERRRENEEKGDGK